MLKSLISVKISDKFKRKIYKRLLAGEYSKAAMPFIVLIIFFMFANFMPKGFQEKTTLIIKITVLTLGCYYGHLCFITLRFYWRALVNNSEEQVDEILEVPIAEIEQKMREKSKWKFWRKE
jgi:hypothetical protein